MNYENYTKEELIDVIEDLEDQIEDLDKIKGNLRDLLKYEYLCENYDKITIDDLEQIVNNKNKQQ